MTAPVDPARWTVDDDGTPVCPDAHGSIVRPPPGIHGGSAWFENQDDFDALVADIRAARAHDHCGHATDTLRQARELATRATQKNAAGLWNQRIYDDAVLCLLDLLAAEGPDHE